MRFLTENEARTWAARFARNDDTRGIPVVPAREHQGKLRYPFENLAGYRYFSLAQNAVRCLDYFDECLLWITQVGVWPSNENLHIYYRLRESYGDRFLVTEKPAVVCLRHESVDLTSLVHLGMLFGWDMFLVTSHDFGRVFISHDGWMQLSEATPNVLLTLSPSKTA
jgi:hypothetical protein